MMTECETIETELIVSWENNSWVDYYKKIHIPTYRITLPEAPKTEE